jgi:2-polyprenyl-3-methyl-5-hydroxy-6-metoxy-1,4-benzoquinol methylase
MFLQRKKRVVDLDSGVTTPQPEGTDSASVEGLKALGLDHLNHVQRMGLRDDTLAGFFNNQTGELFTGFRLDASDVLVDVGCGGGGPLEFAARHAGQIVALDIDPVALEKCRTNLEPNSISQITFMNGSSDAIPLNDQIATKVMCLEVLEHVDDPRLAMSELFRIGQPGSYYLISVPHENSEEILKRIAPSAAYEKPHHIRVFGTEDFKQLISSSGLEIISHDLIGAFSTITVALYWLTDGRVNANGQTQLQTEFVFDNPAIQDWAKAWSFLLDLPNGEELKDLFDSLIPKSQIIVAQKPMA